MAKKTTFPGTSTRDAGKPFTTKWNGGATRPPLSGVAPPAGTNAVETFSTSPTTTPTSRAKSLDVPGHQNAKAHAGVILHRNREPELHMDMPSYELAQLSTDDVYGDGADPIKGVADAMKRLGVEGKVAMVGSDFFPVKYARQLEEETPAIEWVPETTRSRRCAR